MTDNEPLCEANAYTKAKEYAARIEQLEAEVKALHSGGNESLESHLRIKELEAELLQWRTHYDTIEEQEQELRKKNKRIEQLEAHIHTLEFIVAKHRSQDPPESSEFPSLNTPHDPT